MPDHPAFVNQPHSGVESTGSRESLGLSLLLAQGEKSVDASAEFDCVEVLRLGVGSSIVFFAGLLHPCFAGALEVLFDLCLGFAECVECDVHVSRLANQLGLSMIIFYFLCHSADPHEYSLCGW